MIHGTCAVVRFLSLPLSLLPAFLPSFFSFSDFELISLKWLFKLYKLLAPEKQGRPCWTPIGTWPQPCASVPVLAHFSKITSEAGPEAEGLAFPVPDSQVPGVIPLLHCLRLVGVLTNHVGYRREELNGRQHSRPRPSPFQLVLGTEVEGRAGCISTAPH